MSLVGRISDVAENVEGECGIHGDEGEAEALGTLSASSQRRCNSPEKRRARKEHSSNAKPNSRATSDSNANVVVRRYALDFMLLVKSSYQSESWARMKTAKLPCSG